MRRMILFILIIFTFALPVSAVSLSPADREYLIRAVSLSYPDTGYAGRVGICSVVLRRMEDDRFPDTAAGVIAGFGDGSFGFSPVAVPDEKVMRLTSDALDTALSGADPTGGALYFTVLDDGSPVYDLKFDNSGEKRRDRAVENCADLYRTVIDGIGFR